MNDVRSLWDLLWSTSCLMNHFWAGHKVEHWPFLGQHLIEGWFFSFHFEVSQLSIYSHCCNYCIVITTIIWNYRHHYQDHWSFLCSFFPVVVFVSFLSSRPISRCCHPPRPHYHHHLIVLFPGCVHRLQCTKKFTGGVIQWEDADGVRHSGWGGKTDGSVSKEKTNQEVVTQWLRPGNYDSAVADSNSR